MTLISRRVVWTRQPSGAVGIVNGHPSTGGLRYAFLPAYGLRNLLGGNALIGATTATSARIIGSELGAGYGSTSNSALPDIYVGGTGSPGDGLTTAPAWTTLAVVDFFPVPSATAAPLEMQAFPTIATAAYIEQSTSANFRFSVLGAGYTTLADKPAGVVAFRPAGGSVTAQIFAPSGAIQLSASAAFANDGIRFRWARYAAIRGLVAQFVWERVLPEAELAPLRRNPWQLFAPKERRIWVPAAGGATLTVNATVGAATAAGSAAGISLGRTVNASVGAAAAAGAAAGISLGLTANATIGAASAAGSQASISLGTTVNAAVGNAAAAGAQAAISLGTAVQASVGQAVADGLSAAVSLGTAVNASIGAAVADGLQAAITATAAGLTVSAGIGNATAAGAVAIITLTITASAGSIYPKWRRRRR